MSFEIKYDRDGNVIRDKSLELQPSQDPEATEQIYINENNDQEDLSQTSVKNDTSTDEFARNGEKEATEATIQTRIKKPEESFRELRIKAERADKIERERDELREKIYQYENAKKSAESNETQAPNYEEPEEDLGIAPDDIVEGKHLSKVNKQIRDLKQQLKNYETQSKKSSQEANMAATEMRLKAQYSDFDKVVSPENLEILTYTYPELSNTINSSQDLYSKAVSAYMMIKNMGIYKGYAHDAEKQRIQDNAAKPKLSPSTNAQHGESPLSKANAFSNGLTPELQEQLRKEMNLARRAM